jgi:hypothetical protein
MDYEHHAVRILQEDYLHKPAALAPPTNEPLSSAVLARKGAAGIRNNPLDFAHAAAVSRGVIQIPAHPPEFHMDKSTKSLSVVPPEGKL